LYNVSVFLDGKFLVAEDANQYLDLCVEEIFCVMPRVGWAHVATEVPERGVR